MNHINRIFRPTAAAAAALIVLSIFSLSILQGCSSGAKSVVAKIGDYDLSLDEFERQFIRNNGGIEAAKTSDIDGRQEFLDLLVKYRLKVLEARDKGFDKDPEILSELGEYRNSLAEPYLLERAVIDPKIRILYDRRLDEIRAAHILVRPVADSLGTQDTAAARIEAGRILGLALGGFSFDSIAAEYSQDPQTAKKGGDLLWFSAGMTVPDFDNAVYSLKPGEVYPDVVKTVFGYHIVKLLERKRSRGEIRVSHILTRPSQEDPADSTVAFEKIRNILDSLKSGSDFGELAKRNSEDPQSGQNGGELGWVGRRRFVPEFEMVAFELKVGQLSEVVRTTFGYHIIKVLDERAAKPFEESRQELKDLYRRYGFEQDKSEFMQSIEKKYVIAINDGSIESLASALDTTNTTSSADWSKDIPDGVRSISVLTVQDKPVTAGEFVKELETSKDFQSKPLNRSSLKQLAIEVGKNKAMRLETADLEQQYPEFADLMQEYREGVLLFRAEQEAVWNQVKVEESALKTYWEQHKTDYSWPDRVAFSEIFVTNDSLAKVLRDSINIGIDFGELAARHTQRSGYKEKKGDWGMQPAETNELSKKAILLNKGWIEGPEKFQYGYSIIKVTDKDAAREKTFEEAKSEVSSKFQEHESKRLESKWIESLKKKFGVEIDREILKNAFKDLQEKE